MLICDGFDQSLVEADTLLRNYGSLSSIDCDAEELAHRVLMDIIIWTFLSLFQKLKIMYAVAIYA